MHNDKEKAVNVTLSRRGEVVGALRDLSILNITGHALQKLTLQTRKLVSSGRYIDVSHTEYNIHLQMKTTCYIREFRILLANCNRNFPTWPFSQQNHA